VVIRSLAVFTDSFIAIALKPTSAAAQIKSAGWSERSSRLGWLINSAPSVLLHFGFGKNRRKDSRSKLRQRTPPGTTSAQIPTLSKSDTKQLVIESLRRERYSSCWQQGRLLKDLAHS
jgi:hypothetical protein